MNDSVEMLMLKSAKSANLNVNEKINSKTGRRFTYFDNLDDKKDVNSPKTHY